MRVLIGALLLVSAQANAQTAQEVFAERALALALDDRCSVFNEYERRALDASYLQARNSLIRSGVALHDIEGASETIVRQSSDRPCDHEGVVAIAASVQAAFTNWRRELTQNYPGDGLAWSAARPVTGLPEWAVMQQIGIGEASALLGLFGINADQRLTLGVPIQLDAAMARLVVRNTETHPALFDPTLGGLLSVSGLPDWVRYITPENAQSVFLASSLEQDEIQTRIGFNPAAQQAIEQLDPRESIRLEVFNRRGDRVATYFAEVGDFAAAAAFVESTEFSAISH